MLANALNPPEEVVCVVVVARVAPNPVFPNASSNKAICPKTGCTKPVCPNPGEEFHAFVVGELDAFADDAGLLFGSKVPLEVSPVKAPKVGRLFEESTPPKIDDGLVWLEAVEGEPKAPNRLLTASEFVDAALPKDNPSNPGV